MDNKAITKAKVGLILDHPFFATLMLRKNFISDPNVQTTQTNGNDIRYNPEYIEKVSFEELKATICQNVMHTALMHHLRREGREPGDWNKACDYAVNQILKDSGMKLPKDFLHSDQYRDMPAESIYNLIAGKKPDPNGPPNAGQGQGQGQGQPPPPEAPGPGEVVDAPTNDGQSPQEKEAQAKQELAQAMQIAKQQGKLPAGLERTVMEVLEAKVPWKEVLARFLTEPAKNDYSFSKPNTRDLQSGFILPSLYSLEIAEVFLFIDTSGSIDDELLQEFAGEMQEICSTYNCPIKILYVDTEVAGEQIIEPDDVFELKPAGGGGTDFRPGFAWLEERNIIPKSVVYFTDGCCSSFPDEPDYPVLWAQWGDYRFNPRFGEVIKVS
jgi:predicted metal-dependent peptidase